MNEDTPWGADQFSVGSQVAGYRLEEMIGRGGMAAVYRAHDLRLDRRVALKLLAPALARDEAFRQRFIRESRAAAAVDHPHIIPIFDAGEASGVLFIAMRYVPGGDLRGLLDRVGALPAMRAAQIVAQTASALDAAHAHGLVHRDVKPANILLDPGAGHGQPDHVYLSDFGLSKNLQRSTALTATGQFLGTLDYVAPEQIQGHHVDGRADEYALACAAFEMLCNAPPFARDQHMELMWAQISEPPPLLSARRPDLPRAVDQVMAMALAKSPDERYPQCTDFAVALRSACGLGTEEEGLGGVRRAPGWPDRGAAAGVQVGPRRPVGDAAATEVPPAGADPAAPAQPPRTELSMPTPGPDPAAPAQPPRTELSMPTGHPDPGRGRTDRPTDPRPGRGAATEGFDIIRTEQKARRATLRDSPLDAPYLDREPGRRPWWRSRAMFIVAGIVVVGLAGLAVAIGAHRGGQGSSVAAPVCTTTVVTAATQPIAGIRTDTVQLPAKPFAVGATPDSQFVFVTLANSVAVMRNGQSLVPTLLQRIHVPSSRGLAFTRNARYLVVASGSGAVVINVAQAEQGGVNPVVGSLSSPGGSGAIEVLIPPDNKFAFVTLYDSGRLAVFNLQAALTHGFGPANLVGTVPLGVKPAGMRVSGDGRYLYVTSERRTPQTAEGTLSVLDLHRVETQPASAVTATVSAGCDTARVIDPGDGSVVWVTARASNALLGFSAAKLVSDPRHALIARLQVGAGPNGLTSIDRGKRIFVADSNVFSVSGATPNVLVVDGTKALAGRPAVLGAIGTGLLPWQFTVEHGGRTLLVTNSNSKQLEGIDVSQLP